jgi:hypothetical protein
MKMNTSGDNLFHTVKKGQRTNDISSLKDRHVIKPLVTELLQR